MTSEEAGHVVLRVYRRNGKIGHTFKRHGDMDWTQTTPSSAKLRRRWVGSDGRDEPPPWPDDLDPESGMIVYTTEGTWEADPRSHGTLRDGIYTLGDGIPPISEDKLALAERMRAGGEPVPVIAATLRVSVPTMYRLLAERAEREATA